MNCFVYTSISEKLNLDLDSEFLLLSLVQILGFSNSVCNPVIYAALNTNFKRDLLALLMHRRIPCFRRRQTRVGVSVTEPRTTMERMERRVRVQPWSKVAWDTENGVALVTNGTRTESFNPMNLLGSIWPSHNSGTVILNVTDPVHMDATYRSDQKTAEITSG
ncbi:pyroglutamylated RF-amide peptide receptor [Tachysurus ichikawai]